MIAACMMTCKLVAYGYRCATVQCASFYASHGGHCEMQIKELGAKAGVVLNPATPIDALKHVIDIVDLVLVRSVDQIHQLVFSLA